MNPETKTIKSELKMGISSVIDFEKVRGFNLTYKQAQKKLVEIQRSEGLNSGLTVVTNSVAARILPPAGDSQTARSDVQHRPNKETEATEK